MATTLTQIIKEDLCTVGQILKGVARGVVHGIYTPAFVNTGMRQLIHEANRENNSVAESVAEEITQVVTAAGIFTVSTMYAVDKEMTLEYFEALTATNIADYFVHAYKRSKKVEAE